MDLYRERLAERGRALEEAERTENLIGNARLGLALFALVLIVLPLFIKHGAPWWGLVPVGFIFLGLGVWHDRASVRLRRWKASVHFYQRGVDRLDEKWRTFSDDGADLAPEYRGRAIYADDLDLFGPASLFQLLTRAVTAHGRRMLAVWLVSPADRAEIERRQAAVRELAAKLDDREELVASSAGEDPSSAIDDRKLLDWAEKSEPMPRAKLLRILGIVQPILLVAAGLLTYFGVVAPIVLVVTAVLHLTTLFATRGMTNLRAEVLSGPDRALSRYASMIAAVESFKFEAPLLTELKARLLTSSGGEELPASAQIRSLHGLVNLLDARLNMFFALSIGPITMWDLNLVLRAERFRTETGPKLRGWLGVLGELEALSSFAALAWERPDYGMPKIVEGAPQYRAKGLAHPLIDRRSVVANDLELGGPGSVLLLSGSNMSGKSTLLRSVGMSWVLARAGAPVAARELELSAMALVTSVRIVDSLAAGTSHFYAELKRLKQIVDAAERGNLLYLLDEMLHGTNSRERYIGAVSVIRWLSKKGAMGIVTTHDLALSDVERELAPGLARNSHFGDEVKDGEIRFDYRLRDGKLSSTNALRLMRAVGIDVEMTEG